MYVHVRESLLTTVQECFQDTYETYSAISIYTWVQCTFVCLVHAVKASVSWNTRTAVVIRHVNTCSSI